MKKIIIEKNINSVISFTFLFCSTYSPKIKQTHICVCLSVYLFRVCLVHNRVAEISLDKKAPLPGILGNPEKTRKIHFFTLLLYVLMY